MNPKDMTPEQMQQEIARVAQASTDWPSVSAVANMQSIGETSISINDANSSTEYINVTGVSTALGKFKMTGTLSVDSSVNRAGYTGTAVYVAAAGGNGYLVVIGYHDLVEAVWKFTGMGEGIGGGTGIGDYEIENPIPT